MEQMTLDDVRKRCFKQPATRLTFDLLSDLAQAVLALDLEIRNGDAPSVIPHEVRERLEAYQEVPRDTW